MRLYIAGPMQGYPKFNFPLFDTAAEAMRRLGFEVVNPAEHDRGAWPDIVTWPGYETGDVSKCPSFDLARVLRWDFQQVMQCDAIVMLPGWERSTGACDERRVAERTGLRVFSAHFDQDDQNPLLVEEPPNRMGTPPVKEAA